MNTDTHISQMASLYVGDLHPDITESDLYDKFSAAGTILSIRICRDEDTLRSLGYGYVNFQNTAEAERILDTMNFETIRNMPIRMMWYNLDPTVRRSGIGNIYLKNLQKEIDTKALFDTFSAFGNIISCKVALDDKGKSKGFGYIHYETEEASNTAIEKVNGKLLNGKRVYVSKFIPRHERQKDIEERQSLFTNVYVKNLVEDIDDAKLKTMFERFGNITSCKVMCMDDGKSRGFGFVAFTTTEAAQAAVEALNGQEVNESKNLFVSRAQNKFYRERELKRKFDDIIKQRNVNLHVKNLDETFDDERLRQLFSKYGTVTSAVVMTDEQRRSRGFGFVSFSTPNEATWALTLLSGRVVGSKRLFVSLALRKKDRDALLAAQYSAQHMTGFDFTATVRNSTVQQQVQAPPQLPQQKQILGERLYPLIERMHGRLAGKITGMLLEIENSELLHMLEDNEALKAKVQEAIAVLQVQRYKPAN